MDWKSLKVCLHWVLLLLFNFSRISGSSLRVFTFLPMKQFLWKYWYLIVSVENCLMRGCLRMNTVWSGRSIDNIWRVIMNAMKLMRMIFWNSFILLNDRKRDLWNLRGKVTRKWSNHGEKFPKHKREPRRLPTTGKQIVMHRAKWIPQRTKRESATTNKIGASPPLFSLK